MPRPSSQDSIGGQQKNKEAACEEEKRALDFLNHRHLFLKSSSFVSNIGPSIDAGAPVGVTQVGGEEEEEEEEEKDQGDNRVRK